MVDDGEGGGQFRGPSESEPQDWRQLQHYLAGQGMDLHLDVEPRQFRSGFANLNYLVLIDGQEVVLRRPPPGPLPPGAYDMAREHKILSRLWEHFALAPRGIHLCEDERVLGAPFQLTEYRPGISVRDRLPTKFAGDQYAGRQLGEMLIETLARLHSLDPEVVGLDDLGKPVGFLKRSVEGWLKRAYRATEDNPDGEVHALIRHLGDWLRRNKVSESGVCLLHNDFKLDNILLDPETLAPMAVVDWDQGTRGDGLFDLSMLLCYWVERSDPLEVRELRQMPTLETNFPSRREAVEMYAQLTGRDLPDLTFHRTLATFKIAVIFEQLHRRWRHGSTSDPRYAEFGVVVKGLLEFAHEISMGRAL